MANRIKGITIDIGANTVKLTDALKDVDKRLKSTQTQLNDVNRLLKLDPKNTELLAQKQTLLQSAIKDTKARQEELNKALEAMKASGDASEEAIRQQNALKREIESTNVSLRNYQAELSKLTPSLKSVADGTQALAEKTRAFSAVAVGALAGLGTMAVKAGQTADELNTLSAQTGFSTEELQKFRYAADRVDVSMETITGAAAKMTKNLSSSESKFSTLNVATRNSDGTFRNVNEIFYDTVAALGNVSNETERDILAMDIFGKSANDLAGIIDDGGAALRAFGQEAENAGLILSQDALDAANEFNNKIDELKAKAEAAFLNSGAALADSLIPALEKLLEVGTKVMSFIASLDSGTLETITIILALSAVISPVLSALSAGIKLFSTISTAMTAASTVTIPALGASLSALIPILGGVAAAAMAAYAILYELNKAKIYNDWNDYNESTNGMHMLTADQAANWMNKSEVQTMVNPAGETRYYVADANYSWDKANSAANGWTDAAVWGDNATTVNNYNMNIAHVDDLQDVIDMTKQAKQIERMGGVN